jgi:hypothetical protein
MSVFRYLDVEELEIRNSLFTLDTEVASGDGDVKDIGFIGKYDDAGTLKYAGLFRDASDSGLFKIFYGLTAAPNVDTGVISTGSGFTRASLEVYNLHAYNDITIDNNFTVNGTVTAVNVNTLTVEDNIIVANSGPANVKEDAGFVIKRPVSAVITDTAKFTGTASAGGTTTTVALATQTSRATDFYVGWVVKLAGDVTHAGATVTASTSGVNPVLTFDVAASASTTTSTTYELFNKRYTGMIWDESTDRLTYYGFPREDLMGVIDPAGDAGDGNLADYIDGRARDYHLSRDLYVEGIFKTSVNIEDNIVVANVSPSGLSEDHGFVSERSPTFVVTQDTPKHNDQVIDANYTANDTTIDVQNAATGTDYFKGWIIRYNANTADARTITASTETAGVHTLTLSAPWSVGLTAGSDTVDLYNKRFVGQIYDESADTMRLVGFPREAGETVIDPVSPVNGNIPDYINLHLQDLEIHGNLNFTNGYISHTLTLTTGATLTTTQVYQYDIIYFNPSSDQTWTLPTIASMAFLANRSKQILFVNISSNKATIARNSTDTIEGLTQIVLSKLYSKTMLIGSSEHATYWTIKG